MHGAVGKEHAPQPVGFEPIAVEEKKTFTGFTGNIQPLAYLIEVFAVGLFTDRTSHFIAGQQFALAMAEAGQRDRLGFTDADQTEGNQKQGNGEEPRQPGGCKLKTAPVRPVVAARPAEYVCSEDLFY